MIREFPLPDLGEGLTESEIVAWRVAVGDHVAGRGVQLRDGARVRGRQLDDSLGRLDFGDRLVERDGVALGDEPLHEFGLGKTFTQVGELEVLDHSSTPVSEFGRSSTRSTASRIRSRSGR